MTILEKLGLGVQTTVLGMVVVFICLILIILVTMLLSFMARDHKKKNAEAKTAAVPIPKVPMVQVQDDELLAVITAAVAVAMQQSSTGGFVVKSYKRVGGSIPWAKAGRDAQIYNKF
ncbi:MAG: OadG family protein [Christensenellaceae bacterium]